jgi:hypothetical protein
MSGFFSTKYLKYRPLVAAGRPEPQQINDDRACDGCGYNLRGLSTSGNCPECGLAIEPPLDADRPGLGRPVFVLDEFSPAARRLGAGLGLAFACLVTVVVARFAVLVLGVRGISTGLAASYVGVALAVAGAWTIASWLMTPAVFDQQWPWMRPLRYAIRASQPLWVIGCAMWLLAVVDGNAALNAWSRLLRLAAGVGAIALAFALRGVAEALEREDVSRRLNAVVWLLPVLTLLAHIFPGRLAWFELVLVFCLLLLWAWVMALYALGVLALQRHLSWSRTHALARQSRHLRVAETRDAMQRQADARVRPISPPPPELPLDPPDGSR